MQSMCILLDIRVQGCQNSTHEPSGHLRWHDLQTLSCSFFCFILYEIHYCCSFLLIMTIVSNLSMFCNNVNKTVTRITCMTPKVISITMSWNFVLLWWVFEKADLFSTREQGFLMWGEFIYEWLVHESNNAKAMKTSGIYFMN